MDNDKAVVKDCLTTEQTARAEAKRYLDSPKHKERHSNRYTLFKTYENGYIDGFNEAKQLLNDGKDTSQD